MKSILRIRKLFWISAGLLTGMSLTFLLMPLASRLSEQSSGWSVRIVGIIFWILAIVGYGSIAKANKFRKRFLNMKFGRDIQKNFRPGVFCVFSNKIAEVVDIMLAVFLVAFIVSLFTPLKNTYYIAVILSFLVWAANMHCLFNGRTYCITKYDQKERKSYE